MKKAIIICALALLPACVTAADLYEISDAVREMELGKADAAETGARIDAVIETVEERTARLTNPDSLPTTPGGWAAWLIAMGVAGGGGAVGLNRYRDGKRKKLGADYKP